MRPVEALWYAADLDGYRFDAVLRVLSVHEQVINIEVSGWPHLLMLAAPTLPRGPAVVGLPAAAYKSCRAKLPPGAAGRFSPGAICWPGTGEAPAINWRGRPVLSFTPPGGPAGRVQDIKSTLRRYRQLLDRAGFDSAGAVLLERPGGEPYFRQAIQSAYPILVHSLLDNNEQEFNEACRKLIGLGRGATPTGDDLIYGSLTAYHFYRRVSGDAWAGPRYADGVLQHTSPLGRHLLEMGRKGLTPEPLRDFLNSILRGSYKEELLEKLTQIGSTTGFDITIAVLSLLNRIYF
ncbi:MAG: DUF2877 domain-containing protein [Bacillota bacterium]